MSDLERKLTREMDDSEKEYSGDETVSSHEYDSGDDSDDESEIPEENSELDEEEYEY